jgi:hypothetical protein
MCLSLYFECWPDPAHTTSTIVNADEFPWHCDNHWWCDTRCFANCQENEGGQWDKVSELHHNLGLGTGPVQCTYSYLLPIKISMDRDYSHGQMDNLLLSPRCWLVTRAKHSQMMRGRLCVTEKWAGMIMQQRWLANGLFTWKAIKWERLSNGSLIWQIQHIIINKVNLSPSLRPVHHWGCLC